LAALVQAAPKAAAPPLPQAAVQSAYLPIERRVVILYNSATGQTPSKNIGYQGFQTVLNYYGLTAEYVDVAQRPLPSDEYMNGVRAVIVALNSASVDDSVPYLQWVLRQANAKKKLIISGLLGFGTDISNQEAAGLHTRIFEYLGLRIHGQHYFDRSKLKFVKLDPELTGYERKYPRVPPHYAHFDPIRPDVRPLVTIERTDKADSVSVMAALSSTGGFLMPEFDYWDDPLNFQRKWYIDPFAFLSRALDLKNVPVPDPTTINGLRVAFSHVDADGFSGTNQIDRKKICAEIMRDAIFKAFDFPISYSVIQAEVDPSAQGSEHFMNVARSIMELSNIEPASHTYSHPFFWDSESSQKDRYDDRFAFDIPGYQFDAFKEIVNSVEFVTDELCPPGKTCKLLFWSGACDPLAEHQKMANENGVLAINGGDTIWDQAHDSLLGVAPLVRPLGPGLNQIHIGQVNDNILTNLWRGPFNGYRNVIETMKRTGSPRRLKPIDIYYHSFTAEKVAGIEALKEVYNWAITQPIIPVRTSFWIRSVMDWANVRVSQAGPGAYLVENYGGCLSVRLDKESPEPDLVKCENILGFDVQPEGMYVHLVPGASKALLVLAKPGEAPKPVPYLKTASGIVRDFKATAEAIHAKLEFAVSQGRISVGGLRPGAKLQAGGVSVGGKRLALVANALGVAELAGLTSGELEIRLQ
jgi:hypothetical protein